MFQIENVRGEAQRAFGLRRGRVWRKIVRAVDHAGCVERLADLDDGRMRQFGSGAEGEAAIGFQTIGAVERQQAFGSKGIADGFGDAFADPIEILRLRVVKKGQNQRRPAVQRAAPQGGKQRQSAHSSLLYGAFIVRRRAQEPGGTGKGGLARGGGEAFEPGDVRFFAEPGHLALGVVARVALGVEDGFFGSQFTLQKLQSLFVAVRFEGLAGGRESQRENALHLVH